MQPAKQFDLCPWDKLIALPQMGWQHAGWFASYVVNAKNILEWGCGGSTLWMAMMCRGAQIISVEHDRVWYERVSVACKALHDCGMSEQPDGLLLLGSPPAYFSGGSLRACAPYDLIFVDGHERPACLAASYDLLAPGGVVFLHDSQRKEYAKAKRKLLEQPGMTRLFHSDDARESDKFDVEWAAKHPGTVLEGCDDWKDESWVNPRAGMWAAQKHE